jgi:hypothetical protein
LHEGESGVQRQLLENHSYPNSGVFDRNGRT